MADESCLDERQWLLFEEGSEEVSPHTGRAFELEELTVLEVARDLLGSRIKKGKTSPNYRSLCPFHDERIPSFVVYPKSDSYHCYGCGATGGPFYLLFELEDSMIENSRFEFENRFVLDDRMESSGFENRYPSRVFSYPSRKFGLDVNKEGDKLALVWLLQREISRFSINNPSSCDRLANILTFYL